MIPLCVHKTHLDKQRGGGVGGGQSRYGVVRDYTNALFTFTLKLLPPNFTLNIISKHGI